MDKLEYRKHLVAFVDVLGTKEELKTNANELLFTLHQHFKNEIDSIAFANEFSKSENNKIKIFSDNIVIANDCSDYDNRKLLSEFHNIILEIAWFQRALLQNGFLSRGGITYGDLFLDDVFIMGDALVEAYTLENEIAITPRVIIKKELVETMASKKQLIAKDSDGLFYVDYMRLIFASDWNRLFQQVISRNILDGINKWSEDSILKKYYWVRDKMSMYWDFESEKRK